MALLGSAGGAAIFNEFVETWAYSFHSPLYDELVEAGLVRSVEDVFTLRPKQDLLLELDRWGKRSTQNLLKQIDARKQVVQWACAPSNRRPLGCPSR